MAINVGSVEVSVVPVARTFDRDLAAQLNPAAKKAGEQAGQDWANSVQERVRKNPPKVDMPTPDGKKSDAEVDRFLRDFNARMKKEYDQTGQDSASAMANGMRLSFLRNSPLIAAAVSGALALGTPAVLGAAGAMFIGIAALSEKSNAQLKADVASTGQSIGGVFQKAAAVDVPYFEAALNRVDQAAQGLAPQLHQLFSGLGGPIDSLTTGVINFADNAMPGAVNAVRGSGPVFQGLATFLGDAGTGVSDFFNAISEHGQAGGKVLADVGQIVREALPILGQLIGEGAELGKEILPPLVFGLHAADDVLHVIAPVLPEVAMGFIALKVVQTLNGPLATFEQNMAAASYNGTAFAGVAGKASTGASALQSALGPLAAATVIVGVQQGLMSQQADQWAQALQRGGQAAAGAREEMRKTAEYGHTFGTGFLGFLTSLFGLKPVTDWAKSSGQDLTGVQKLLNGALNAGSDTAAKLKGNLQLTADAASQANTEIGLLKGGLDALTGANVTLDQAEIAVTQSTDAITQAVKGHSAALVFNKDGVDRSNAGSAQASQLLIQLAGNMKQQIATMQEQGDSAQVLNAKTDDLRNQFIKSAEQMGANADEAKALADRYFGIPDQVHTQLTADAQQANGVIDAVQTRINQLMTDHIVHLSAVLQTGNMIGGLGFNAAKATGGPIFGPGTGTSDTAGLFALSNGEHVWTASEVSAAGGHAAVEALRANALAYGRGMAAGGAVDRINVTAADTGFGAAVGNMNQSIWQAANQIAAGASTAGSGGAARWAPVVLQALAMLGLPATWLGSTLRRMNQESGGNPFAINLWDSNAMRGDPSRGLMQTIGSTFRAFALPGYNSNIYDPLSNLLASMRYAMADYGSLPAAYDRPGGYKLGTNYVPSDGLAYLHRGEAVVPASQNQGDPWQPGNVTVIAQFGNETIEATAVRVVNRTNAQAALSSAAGSSRTIR